jgi:MFS transporter, DHA2 family, multidrug resistance protein
MASYIAAEWATDDFLPSQILRAFGQSSTLIALVLFAVGHLRPADAITFGVLQTARLLGGRRAMRLCKLRVREQIASNLIGLHVMNGGGYTGDRMTVYIDAVLARSVGVGEASARGASLLATVVREQASLLSYRDGFAVVALTAIGMLVLTALLRASPDRSV